MSNSQPIIVWIRLECALEEEKADFHVPDSMVTLTAFKETLLLPFELKDVGTAQISLYIFPEDHSTGDSLETKRITTVGQLRAAARDSAERALVLRVKGSTMCIARSTGDFEQCPNRWDAFVGMLKTKINEPKEEILLQILERYHDAIAGASRSVLSAVALYDLVNAMPNTATLIALQNELNLHINGPMSTRFPDILTAVDEEDGLYVLKLLRSVDQFPHGGYRSSEAAQEQATCERLDLDAPIVALCPVKVLSVIYQGRVHTVLKMPTFLTTLADRPQPFSSTIVRRGRELMDAVQFMHSRGIVHMDIKSDNIFIGSDKSWVLGDFGSSRRIDDMVTSTYLISFARFRIVIAQPIYDWFMLLVMLLKESLPIRDEWISVLCGRDMKYDAIMINAYICQLDSGSALQQLFVDLQVLSGSCTSI